MTLYSPETTLQLLSLPFLTKNKQNHLNLSKDMPHRLLPVFSLKITNPKEQESNI